MACKRAEILAWNLTHGDPKYKDIKHRHTEEENDYKKGSFK